MAEEAPMAGTQVAEYADSILWKCAKRGCRLDDGGEAMCGNKDCGRCMHPACFHAEYVVKKNLEPLPNNGVACTKKCYDAIMRIARATRPNWSTDGALGPSDPRCSERILMDWLLTPGNYAKYCGKKNNSVKKNQFCRLLADLINAENVKLM